jgi:uncharacterized BrkB/YihY/UPF0761 family membrane protein
MNAQLVLNIFDIIGLIMMLAIILFYGLASFWNIKFLTKTEWQEFSWIKVYSSIVCVLMSIAYIFLIIKFMLNEPMDTTLFGIIIIRPLILLMGGAFASSARARLTSLRNGGNEKWMLRNGRV